MEGAKVGSLHCLENSSVGNPGNRSMRSPSAISMRTTPDKVTKLEPHEIFVFGSNLKGRHGKGAALDAAKYFGAKEGIGRGFSGQSYALPTKDESLRTLPLIYIGNRVHEFLLIAETMPDFTFLVSQIGCGYAGYTPVEIAPLFFVNKVPKNVILPESFWYAGLRE